MKTNRYDRGAIMRRAWEIARETREADAQKAHDRDVSRFGERIVHNRTLAAHLAETHADFASAMKQAWAEAKARCEGGASRPAPSCALTVIRSGAPATRSMRIARVFGMVKHAYRRGQRALRFLDRHFIPEGRAA